MWFFAWMITDLPSSVFNSSGLFVHIIKHGSSGSNDHENDVLWFNIVENALYARDTHVSAFNMLLYPFV